MGQRVVIIAGIPVLVPDDSDVGLPPAREPATFDAAPTPGVDIPDTASAQTVEPPMSPEEEARLEAMASADTQALLASPEAAASPAPAGQPGIVDPFAGQPAAPDATPAPDAAQPMLYATTPGEAIAGGARKIADVATGDFGAAPAEQPAAAPPAADPVPETPEEAQARRDAKRAYLERQFSALDDEALSGTATPERRLNIVAEQGAIADLLKATAEEDALVAGDSVKVEQERVKAEAAQQIARQEAEAAARARALEVARQKAEHHIAQIEEQANKPVDRSLGLGIGKSILLALSLVAGGLGSALRGQGDKNPALDILMRNIDQHVADQWARKKELWGQVDRIAKGMGEMDDKAAVRLKLLESYKTSVLLKASKEMERIAKDLPVAKRAAALQLAADTRTKAVERRRTDADNLVKWSIERDKMAEAERNNRAQNRASLISAGAAATNARTNARQQKFEEDKYNSEEAVLDRRIEREKKLVEIEEKKRSAATDAEKKRLDAEKAAIDLEEAKDDRVAKSLTPTVIIDPATNKPLVRDGKIVVTVGNFKQPDGKTDVVLNPGAGREKVRTGLAAAAALTAAVDELVEHVATHGWEPGVLQTDAYLKAKSLYGVLYLEGKDTYELGALQESEKQILDGVFGGNPSRLIGNPIVSLREARKTMARKAYYNLSQRSDYSGTEEDFLRDQLPEQTRYGTRERIQNTPEGNIVQGSEARGFSGEGSFMEQFQRHLETWGDSMDIEGTPTAKAADDIYRAADIAMGLTSEDPEVGKRALRHLIENEQHGPAWRLASSLAFDNKIDLGTDFYNEQAYKAVEGAPEPVVRSVYGSDPTAGQAGTPEYRAKRDKMRMAVTTLRGLVGREVDRRTKKAAEAALNRGVGTTRMR